MGVPSPWALMGAPAGRWGTRPCRVWMLLASGVWSHGGRFQNPRAPGWCRLTGTVGPRRLRASPTRWPGRQAWGGGAPCRQAELVLEWGPLWGAAPDGRGGPGGSRSSCWLLVCGAGARWSRGAGWCWVWSALGGPGLGGAGLWFPFCNFYFIWEHSFCQKAYQFSRAVVSDSVVLGVAKSRTRLRD